MILLSNQADLLMSVKTTKNQQPAGADNKNLWKLALEKSSLHLALSKFESISEGVRSKKTLELSESEPVKKSTKTNTDTGDVIQSNIGMKLKNEHARSFTETKVINITESNISSNTLQPVMLGEAVLNRSFTTLEEIAIAAVYKDLAKNTLWLSKNVIVTDMNSNLEVWIRDASLTSNNLNDILKNVKQYMAELGASLSRVSINGKVTFVRDK